MAVICNYEASAGTGKTYTIKNKFAELVLEGVPADRILAMTYTEAAAAEMRDRIRAVLEERLEDKEKTGLTYDEKNRIRAALTGLGDAWICTIHGFCARVLKEYPFEAGVNCRMGVDNTGFSDKEGVSRSLSDMQARLQRIADSKLSGDTLSKIKGDDYDEKTVAQLTASVHDGDTVNRHLNNESFDGLLETLKAKDKELAELKSSERYQNYLELCDSELGDIAGTNSPISKLRTQLSHFLKGQCTKSQCKIEDIHLDAIRIYDRMFDTNHREVCQAITEWQSSRKNNEKPSDELLNKVRSVYDDINIQTEVSAKEKKVKTLTDKIKGIMVRERVETAVRISRERRQKEATLSYGDMIELVSRALEYPDSPLGKALRKRFAAGIVDEFQDTDPLQWKIISRIFPKDDKEGDAGDPGRKRRLILAGDPKQSIYGFRGANIGTYLNAVSGRENELLPVSYRFTPRLCHALNCFFRLQKPGFFGGAIDFNPVGFISENHVDLPDGYNSLTFVKPEEKTADGGSPGNPGENIPSGKGDKKKDDNKYDVKAFWDRDYPEFICREIQRIANDAELKFHRKKDEDPHPRYGDVMVLVKKREEAEPLEKLFREKGIPYTFYKKSGLFASEEAFSLYETLLAVYEPSEEHFKTALFGDLFRMAPEDIRKCMDGLESSDALKRLQSWPDRLADRSPGEAADRILSELEIHKKSLEDGNTRRSANYKQLAAVIRAMERKNPDPHSLLAALKTRITEGSKESEDEDEDLMALDTDRDVVKITTMHSAKGLEANAVFLLGKMDKFKSDQIKKIASADRVDYYTHYTEEKPEDGQSIKEKADAAVKEEQHRLLYVAMTRARVLLYMPQPGDKPKLSIFYSDGIVPVFPNAVQDIRYRLADGENGMHRYEYSSGGDKEEWYDIHTREIKSVGSGEASDGPQPAPPEEQAEPAAGVPEQEPLPEKISCIWLQSFSAIRSKGGKAETADSGEPGTGEQDRSGQTSDTGADTAGADGADDELRITAEDAGESAGGSDEPEDLAEDLEGELPGGTVTGNIVHEAFDAIFRHPELKEKIYNLKDIDGDGSLFAANDCLRRILDRRSRIVGGRQREYRRGILTILRNALRTPLWKDGPEIGRLDPKLILTERPFVYKRRDCADRDKVYYNGVVDMIFMYDGEYYVLDWKTNRSPSREYGPEDLAGMMAEGDYKKQAGLYTGFVDKRLENAGQTQKVCKAFYVFVRPAEKPGGRAAVFEVSRKELDDEIENLQKQRQADCP